MTACVTFDDLSLGYDSHPAAHHLNGMIANGGVTPSGPAIILSAGVIYILSILAGPRGVLATHIRLSSHRTA